MVINKTNGKVLTQNYEVCKSIFKIAQGLMFSRKKNLVFIFNKEKKVSLHMFFVFFPIDVVFLDNKKKIVEIKENFLPFRLYTSREKAKYVIELTDGTLSTTNSKIGDIIDF